MCALRYTGHSGLTQTQTMCGFFVREENKGGTDSRNHN